MEGDTVTLSGASSFDPDDNIAGYFWHQTKGTAVKLIKVNLTDLTFKAPQINISREALAFQLTVTDS